MSELPTALYVSHGDLVEPTELTRGPWNPDHQHGGPPAALLARALETAGRIPSASIGRLSFDILRPVPLEPLRVSSRVARPGRRVELVEAALMTAGGTELMRASAWRIAGESPPPDSLAAHPAHPLGSPAGRAPGRFAFWRDEIAYHRALDWRFVSGSFDEPGPGSSWSRLAVALVAGEQPSPLERLIVMADAASGLSAVLDWQRWMFINVDLGVHLMRRPRGEWMAMAASTTAGPEGVGLCVGELYDSDGRIGVSTQSLLVAPRPG